MLLLRTVSIQCWDRHTITSHTKHLLRSGAGLPQGDSLAAKEPAAQASGLVLRLLKVLPGPLCASLPCGARCAGAGAGAAGGHPRFQVREAVCMCPRTRADPGEVGLLGLRGLQGGAISEPCRFHGGARSRPPFRGWQVVAGVLEPRPPPPL